MEIRQIEILLKMSDKEEHLIFVAKTSQTDRLFVVSKQTFERRDNRAVGRLTRLSNKRDKRFFRIANIQEDDSNKIVFHNNYNWRRRHVYNASPNNTNWVADRPSGRSFRFSIVGKNFSIRRKVFVASFLKEKGRTSAEDNRNGKPTENDVLMVRRHSLPLFRLLSVVMRLRWSSFSRHDLQIRNFVSICSREEKKELKLIRKQFSNAKKRPKKN